MNHRQATHAISCVLGSWKRNRLAAHSRPPGDAKRLTYFLGCWWSAWRDWLNRQVARGNLTHSWVFWNSWWNLIGAIFSGDSYRVVMLTNSRYNHLIKGLNKWNSVYELGLNVCSQKSQIWNVLLWIGHRNWWSMEVYTELLWLC